MNGYFLRRLIGSGYPSRDKLGQVVAVQAYWDANGSCEHRFY